MTRKDDHGAAGGLPGKVSLETLRDGPFRLSGVLDSAALKALAARFDLIALERLGYVIEVRPWRGGVLAEGTIRAEVVQSCVVTLEPVTTVLDEDFRHGYLPDEELYTDIKPGAELEIAVDSELGDIPEALTDPLDIGEIVAETLSLALPGYPRHDSADALVATAAPKGAEPLTDEKVKPFAALEALKARLEGGGEG